MTVSVQVIEILVEESNVQPVNSPVTVRFRHRASYTCSYVCVDEAVYLSICCEQVASAGRILVCTVSAAPVEHLTDSMRAGLW